LHYKRSNYTKM